MNFQNAFDFVIKCLPFVLTVGTLLWKAVDMWGKNQLKIGLEKAKLNAVGEDALNRFLAAEGKLMEMIQRMSVQMKAVEERIDARMKDMEVDWRNFKADTKENYREQKETLSEWRKSLKDQEDFLNRNLNK